MTQQAEIDDRPRGGTIVCFTCSWHGWCRKALTVSELRQQVDYCFEKGEPKYVKPKEEEL